jgi:hypothetical protein
VAEAIAWEPPALSVLPDGLATHAAMMAPVEAHLRAHPDDWPGAYLVMLEVISNGQADPTSPAVSQALRNAEAIVRDDGRLITRRGFVAGELPADRVTIAVSEQPDPLHLAIAEQLAALTGRPVEHVNGPTTTRST